MKMPQWLALCIAVALASSAGTYWIVRGAPSGRNYFWPGHTRAWSSTQQWRAAQQLQPKKDYAGSAFSSGFGSAVLDSKNTASVDLSTRYAQRHNWTNLHKAATSKHPRVLILTPVKDSAHHLKRFLPLLETLSYPAHCLSIGFLESDSADGLEPSPGQPAAQQHSSTWKALVAAVPRLLQRFSRVTVARHDFGLQLSREERHEMYSQVIRRHVMARARNQLLQRALVDEDWVMWVDSDVQGWPADLVQRLLGANRTIVVPNVVMEPGGRSYDLNSWAARWMNSSRASPGSSVPLGTGVGGGRWSIAKAATKQMQHVIQEARGGAATPHWRYSDLYYAPLVPLAQDAATACLSKLASPALTQAMPWPYASKQEPGCEAVLGTPMIFKHLGGSGVPAVSGVQGGAGGSRGDPEALHPALLLEGYTRHPTIPLHKMRHVGEVVELGGVGGAVLLVWAGLHREGLVFPPFPYRSRIETEGLAAMARDMGHRVWGMPHVEVIHT